MSAISNSGRVGCRNVACDETVPLYTRNWLGLCPCCRAAALIGLEYGGKLAAVVAFAAGLIGWLVGHG